jgi:hypothetical protein
MELNFKCCIPTSFDLRYAWMNPKPRQHVLIPDVAVINIDETRVKQELKVFQ